MLDTVLLISLKPCGPRRSAAAPRPRESCSPVPVHMRSRTWLHNSLSTAMQPFFYRISADRMLLEVVDEASGSVLKSRPPVGTTFVQLLPLDGDAVVREEFGKYPAFHPNVYRLNSSLQVVWWAEWPPGDHVYANTMVVRDNRLITGTWGGYTCELDPATGKLLQTRFTK